jgi:hypothetical protein
MDIYPLTTPATAQNRMVAPTLLDLVDLWRRGVLTGNAKVWIDIDHHRSAFWALTDRSQFVQLITPSTPGYLRVTTESVRWALTNEATVKAPAVQLNFADVPGGDRSRVVLVVRHSDPKRKVQVIHGGPSTKVELEEDGTAVVEGVTVIDLSHYRPPVRRGGPSHLEQADALTHGVEWLCHMAEADFAPVIRGHIDAFRLELDHVALGSLAQMLSIADDFSLQLVDHLFGKVASSMTAQGSSRAG